MRGSRSRQSEMEIIVWIGRLMNPRQRPKGAKRKKIGAQLPQAGPSRRNAFLDTESYSRNSNAELCTTPSNGVSTKFRSLDIIPAIMVTEQGSETLLIEARWIF